MELIKQEKTANSTVTLTVKVSKEKFEEANKKAFAQNSKKLNIDGFRKGKAPRHVIEKMYGKEIFYDEAINLCFPDAYDVAVTTANIDPIARPEVDMTEITEDGFNFIIIAPVYPEMSLKAYKGIEAEKGKVSKATKAEVEAELSAMAKKLSRIETVERKSKKGDIVNFDFEGFIDGVAFAGGKAEGHDLELGSGQFIPGFEEQLIGVKAEDTLDVNVTFPEGYQSQELSGKPAVFKCQINLVKQTILPDMDDEFAKDVSEFDTLEELKTDISQKISEKNKSDVENQFEDNVIKALVENLEGEYPEALKVQQIDKLVQDFAYRIQMQGVTIEDYLKMNGMDIEVFRKLFDNQAEQQVKSQLALNVVVREEKLDITEEELEEEIAKLAKDYNMEVEQVKNVVPMDTLKSDILMTRAAKLVIDSAVTLKKAKTAKTDE
ncbi:MAG: trigger factor [Clostridia bacterium]